MPSAHQDGPMYQVMLAIAVAVLFERMARWEEEPPALWSGLALAGFLLPGIAFGVLWGFAGLLVVGGAFAARVTTRKTQGRGPIR
jgi:hypothetical protein